MYLPLVISFIIYLYQTSPASPVFGLSDIYSFIGTIAMLVTIGGCFWKLVTMVNTMQAKIDQQSLLLQEAQRRVDSLHIDFKDMNIGMRTVIQQEQRMSDFERRIAKLEK